MNKITGLAITIALTLILIFTFFGAPLRSPNTTFFATGGDGLKDYYTTTYLVKHDTNYWHSNAMNYPFGENVMFTGSQPSISHVVKFISTNIVDISGYTVGIINIAMLLSLLLGTIILYFLLIHFKLPYLYSAIVAIGITFLTPQIARMGGHFSLSYVFAIPLILLLTAKFDKKPTFLTSLFMGLFMLWAVGTHVYMLGFYSFVVLLYWLYKIIFDRSMGLKSMALHFSVQFLLPLILFVSVVTLTDSVTDRTAYPWGFLYYRAHIESILLPIGRPYAKFLHSISNFNYIEWEGYAFVGLVASLGFLSMIIFSIRRIVKKEYLQSIWPKGNDKMLNVFFWISIIALLYSFGFPFRWDMPWLVDYIGPLKQMRGIARFSWIFFYVINIYVFYLIWNLKATKLNRYVWSALVFLSVTVLLYDAWYNVNFWSRYLNNKVPEISDVNNELPNNQWINVVDVDKYQAILPIPYFHIGSENIWVDAQKNISSSTFIVSMKTGLPSMGVLMSRTSISQTLSNLQLVWEPYRKPEVLNLLNPNKDILVLAKENDTDIPQSQRDILSKSTLIYQSGEFNLYSLTFDSLSSSFEDLYSHVYRNFSSKERFNHNDYMSTSPEKNFFVDAFVDENSELFYIEGGSKSQGFRPKRMFYKASIPSSEPEAEYVLSFWIHGVYTDLMLRSQLIVEIENAEGRNYFYETHSLSKCIKVIDGQWGLAEVSIKVDNSGDNLGFWLNSYDLRKLNYTVDQVMVRPKNTDVFRLTDKWIMHNNRFYLKTQVND
jgi:hypothetical protein